MQIKSKYTAQQEVHYMQVNAVDIHRYKKTAGLETRSHDPHVGCVNSVNAIHDDLVTSIRCMHASYRPLYAM